MNPKTLKSLSGAFLGLLIFFAVVVLFRIASEKEIPAQFIGALLGAIVTAAITMALLQGQSQAEEAKERNVKVFEEKSRRYNEFLHKLWTIWRDRHITLDELNELMEIVSRDIIVYTKASSTKKLLRSLNGLALHAGQQTVSEDEQHAMQGHVFDIINTLSAEINLGGSITAEIRDNLNELERRIRPILLLREFRQRLLADVGLAIGRASKMQSGQSELPAALGNPFYKDWAGNEYLMATIGGSPVSLCIGPVANITGTEGYLIGFFVEFYSHREFQPYRDAQRGFRKDFLASMKWDEALTKMLPNFHDPDQFAGWIKRYHVDEHESLGLQIGRMLAEYVENWRHEGRSIESIIEECFQRRNSSTIVPDYSPQGER